MVNSIPSKLSNCSVAALLILPWLTMVAAGGEPLPISLVAESSSFDQKSNSVVFRGVDITQGDLKIRADEAVASSMDFEKSEWRFSGHVKITVNSVSIEADSAELIFEAHSLLVANMRGHPAIFQNLSATRESLIHGSANHLHYDGGTRTLRMMEDAWLSDGPNEFTGCDLIFDLEQARITSGSSECGESVIITILPPSDDSESVSAPPP
ncbi:MAG: hypothetical protein E2O55_02950 [Gammaproteobacteria bacterium]|nr:MAG: hypothetical protein E2O55_02950 [Gammaproteobacteria bacterium]